MNKKTIIALAVALFSASSNAEYIISIPLSPEVKESINYVKAEESTAPTEDVIVAPEPTADVPTQEAEETADTQEKCYARIDENVSGMPLMNVSKSFNSKSIRCSVSFDFVEGAIAQTQEVVLDNFASDNVSFDRVTGIETNEFSAAEADAANRLYTKVITDSRYDNVQPMFAFSNFWRAFGSTDDMSYACYSTNHTAYLYLEDCLDILSQTNNIGGRYVWQGDYKGYQIQIVKSFMYTEREKTY